MVILDRDILTCPEDEIRDTRVLRTFLGGKTVHRVR
jgi:predicted amidohydrolase YtcJ